MRDLKIKQKQIHTQHTNIQYLCVEEGTASLESTKPLMVLLHGFPENSWSWEAYLYALSKEYHVVAPDLPGYNESEGFAHEEDYTIMQLVETMGEFVSALLKERAKASESSHAQKAHGKHEKAHVVAHDWGGVIAWPLAAFKADIIDKMTILNAAHPTGFTREMAENPRQQANSDYISDLISDEAFEITSRDDCHMLKRLYGGHFHKLSDQQKTQYLKQWTNKRCMLNAFAYYKNMPQLVTKRLALNTEVKLPKIYIQLPTQVLWGMKDTAFVPEVLNGMEEWVRDLHLVKYDDADHWLHHQKPEKVMQQLRDFHR